MDCVSGCGREISGSKSTQQNFLAATIALELLAWDKNRASPGPGPDGREGLIARGADCYQRLLYSLHGEGGGEPEKDCEAWLGESGELRLLRPEMTKKRFLGRGNGNPALSEHEIAQMDRLHPELSFSGNLPTPGGDEDDDLVRKLERLRALRDDGTLTDDEFAAAKARLLA
jgi:hypothetical protein